MKNFILIIFLLIAFRLEAQYFSVPKDPTIMPPPPTFSVAEKMGCAPFTVTITAPACDGSISCTAIYGDGVLQGFQNGITPPHVYTGTGNFTLEIVYGISGSSVLDIQVFPNVQPTFELYACTGNEVFVKIPDTNYDQYVIDYNDLTLDVIVPKGSLAKDQHLYVSGPQTVSVRGQNLSSAPNCLPGTQTINVTPTLQPASISQLEVISASQIKLDYNDPPVSNQLSTPYQLQIVPNNNIGFGIAQAGYIFNSNTTTFANGVSPDNNFYCFRMGTIDICNSTTPISFSDVICSANFDLTIQSDVNKLNWVTSSVASPISDFSIAKNPGTPIPIAANLNTYSDGVSDIVCNTDYCYQLTTNYANTSRSISLQKCGKSFSDVTPTPVQDISAIVSETGVALTWLQDPDFISTEYTLNKSTNEIYSFLTNTTTPAYSDATYLTELNSCYKISYVDDCLNASSLELSVESCPMRLSGLLSPNNDITLSWSAYTGWSGGVNHYVVDKFTSQGQLISSSDNGTLTTLLDVNLDFVNQTYIYVITAIANDGGVSQSVSNAFRITKEPYLTYPTAFSPRGNVPDNQLFKVFGQYVTSFDLRIFNRWGQEMFYTNDFDKGWDGTYNGSLMPEGTYVFTAKITDQEGKTSDRSGTVVLLVKQ